MKKKTLLKSIWILLVMCGVSANAGAQDLKSILSGVAKAVVGNKATTASSIIGTWTYSGPECQFESENLLAKAGGEMAAKEVEEKMIAVYNKVGMNNIRYTFNEDGTYSYQMKKRTVVGLLTGKGIGKYQPAAFVSIYVYGFFTQMYVHFPAIA